MPQPDAVSPRARHTPTRADAAATSEAQLRGAQMEAGEYATFQSLVRDWSPFETRQAITETAQEPQRRVSVRRDAGALAAYLSQEAVGTYQLHDAKSGGGDGGALPEAPEQVDGRRAPPEVQAYRKALDGAYDAFVHVLWQQNGKHVQQRALVGIEQVPAVFRVPASAFRLEDTEAYQGVAAVDDSEAMSEHEAAAQQELRRYWAFCEASMRAQLLDSTRAARGADVDALLHVLSAVRERSLQPAVDALHRMRERGDSARARLQHSRTRFQQLLKRRRQLTGLLRTLECLQRAHNQLRAVHELLQAHDWLRAARLHCEWHCLLRDGSIDTSADDRRHGTASDTAGTSTRHWPALSVRGELERQHVAHSTALHDGIVQLAMSRFSEVVTLAPEATPAAATDTAAASSPLDIDAYRSEMRAYVQALNELGSLEHALDRFVHDALDDLATVAVSAASMHEDDSAQAFVAVLDRCEVLAEGVAVLLELCWDAREQPSLSPTARPDGAAERTGGRTRALTAASNTFLGELLGRIGRILPRLLPPTDQPVEPDAERWAAAWQRLTRFHRRLGDRFARMCTVLPTAAPLTSLLEEHTMQWLQRRHEECLAEVERALERDTWSRSTSLPSVQATVDMLATLVGGPAAVSGSTSEGAATVLDGLWIHGTAFVVADAVGPLLTALCRYVQCAVQLDAYASGALRRALCLQVCEVLRLFNARAAQLVLGAGAMQTAALKSITARHLAVCVRTLDALIALQGAGDAETSVGLTAFFLRFAERSAEHDRATTPEDAPPLDVRASVAASARPLVQSSLESVRQDLDRHRQQLLDKVVSIMGERLKRRVVEMRKVPWAELDADEGAQNTRAQPSAYASVLVKEVTTLHNILQPILGAVALEYLVEQISGIYAQTLRAEFARIVDEYLQHPPTKPTSTPTEPAALSPPQRARIWQQLALDARWVADGLQRLQHAASHNNRETRTVLEPLHAAAAEYERCSRTCHEREEERAAAEAYAALPSHSTASLSEAS